LAAGERQAGSLTKSKFIAFLLFFSKIHDGHSSSSYMIGRFCGSTLPKGGNIITTHNQLYLWFRSDNSTSSDGFELSWESIDPGKKAENLFFMIFAQIHFRFYSLARRQFAEES
jgi:CUB domain